MAGRNNCPLADHMVAFIVAGSFPGGLDQVIRNGKRNGQRATAFLHLPNCPVKKKKSGGSRPWRRPCTCSATSRAAAGSAGCPWLLPASSPATCPPKCSTMQHAHRSHAAEHAQPRGLEGDYGRGESGAAGPVSAPGPGPGRAQLAPAEPLGDCVGSPGRLPAEICPVDWKASLEA